MVSNVISLLIAVKHWFLLTVLLLSETVLVAFDSNSNIDRDSCKVTVNSYWSQTSQWPLTFLHVIWIRTVTKIYFIVAFITDVRSFVWHEVFLWHVGNLSILTIQTFFFEFSWVQLYVPERTQQFLKPNCVYSYTRLGAQLLLSSYFQKWHVLILQSSSFHQDRVADVLYISELGP